MARIPDLANGGALQGADAFVVARGAIEVQLTGLRAEFDAKSDVGHTHAGGSAAWGGITGTLSAQTDLQGELDGKEDTGVAAAAVTTHEGAVDPHTAYLTSAEANAAYEAIGAVAAHAAAANPHPVYLTASEGDAAYEALGAVATHAAAADPHTGYQRESEKNAVSGYAGLDASSKLTGTQQVYGAGVNTACQGNDARLADARTPLTHNITTSHNGFPGGTANFLRADGTFASPPGGGGGTTKISGNSGAFAADTTWETLTADSTGITSTTQTTVMTVTGLGAGTYRIKGTLIWSTAATGTGIGITLNHTGTLTQFVSTWWTTTTGGAAATGIADQVTATAAGQLVEGKSERVKDTRTSFNVGTDTANGTQLSIIEALMIVSVSGDLQLKIATEVAGSAATLRAGSTIEVNKVV